MRMFTVVFALVGSFALSASIQAEMSIAITSPQHDAIVSPCRDQLVTLDVQNDGNVIKDVRIYANGSHKARLRSEPWEYTWKNMASGRYELQAKLTTQDGVEVWSEPVLVRAGLVSHGEMVQNGHFNCGTTLAPWGMNVNTGEGAVATGEVIEDVYFDDIGYLFIDITNRGSADWHVQLQQPIPVDSGHVYTITLLADADDQKIVRITMQENQDPWTIQFTQEFTIDGADQYGPFEFIAQYDDPTNYIRFNLGLDTSPVYFDNIRVIDHSISSVKEYSFDGAVKTYDLLPAYPNPFNMNTTIPFSLSRAEKVELSIYNTRGQLVKTLVNGEKGAGLHNIHWDGMDSQQNMVPSGIYFYKLTVKSVSESPVNLSRKIVLMK